MPELKWTKRIEQCSGSIVRIACLPEPMHEAPPTFAVRDRNLFRRARTRREGESRVFQNKRFCVRIRDDGKPLSRGNLEVRWTHAGREHAWRPGQQDRENLGGAYTSLDLFREGLVGDKVRSFDPMKGFDAYNVTPVTLLEACRDELRARRGLDCDELEWFKEFWNYAGGKNSIHFRRWPDSIGETARRVRQIPPGLLSRSGLTIFRDDSPALDNAADWIVPRREVEPQIIYLVFYGNDFKQGLSDLSRLLGPMPNVPKWALGVWYSCYRRMGEAAFRRTKEDFDAQGLPLDVVVVDTDWHRYFWHGFDWNLKLFPEPGRFKSWLRSSGLHAAFNVHPQYIPSKDSRLPEFLRRTGTEARILDERTAPHPFHAGCHAVDLFDRTQARVYFDLFHRPIEREGGCALWWVDGGLKDAEGRSVTAWLNELYARRGRGLSAPVAPPRVVLSRGQGLGGHRALLQFTGDTYSQWGVLELQARITPLGSNSFSAFMSHDIGGFFKGDPSWKQNKPPDDLMVRWVQFGCLSPLFRLHSDHGIREPWRFRRSSLEIMRQFMLLRRRLGPYLRRLAVEAHAGGVGLCRPMYYEFPGEPDAYCHPGQYMLGEELLVSPVTNPAGEVMTWFPPGRWRHCFLERVVQGPCTIQEHVPLSVMPLYRRDAAKGVPR